MSLDVDFKVLKTAPDLRDGSVVKCTGHSSRGLGFDSQDPHGGSQTSKIPFLGDLTDILMCTDTTSRRNTPLHKKQQQVRWPLCV